MVLAELLDPDGSGIISSSQSEGRTIIHRSSVEVFWKEKVIFAHLLRCYDLLQYLLTIETLLIVT